MVSQILIFSLILLDIFPVVLGTYMYNCLKNKTAKLNVTKVFHMQKARFKFWCC